MEIFIYEDQNGKQLYPEGSNHNEEYIKKQFFNNITLDLNRKGDLLEITCFVVARGIQRIEGYYIKYIDKYSEKIYEKFKNQADIALLELNYKPRLDDIRNTIFNNITKFDKYQADTNFQANTNFQADINYYAENKNDVLEYLGGDIYNLSLFCINILRQFKNVEVVISFNKCKYGNFNIFIENNNYEGIIQKTRETEQKLSKYNLKSMKLEKETKIKNGKNLIKSGIDELFNSGLNKNEVKDILTNLTRSYGLEMSLHKEEKPRLEEKSIKERKTVGGLDHYEEISKISGSTPRSNFGDKYHENIATKRKQRLPIIKIISVILLSLIVMYLFINTSIFLPYINGDILNSNNELDDKIIKIENNRFVPNTTEINVGQKVKWQNNDNISYNLIGLNLSIILNIGEDKEQVFNETGEFNFSIINDTSYEFDISQIIVQ